MQTESRIRLLRKNNAHEGGYEIVGYQHNTDGGVHWHYDNKLCGWDVMKYVPPPHDAFELGVKVGDEWIYAGDRIRDCDGHTGTVIYDCAEWFIAWDGDKERYTPIPVFVEAGFVNHERIGTIHDEVKKDGSAAQ